VLGVHGDPLAARRRIDKATREGVRLGKDAYGYSRAFLYSPSSDELAWISSEGAKVGAARAKVLDPTAGGGSIPFESARMGYQTYANDLNPVASLVERATVEWPLVHGLSMLTDYKRIGAEFITRVKARLAFAFPPEPESDTKPDGYLWARTIRCPHCEGVVPLAPNWRLSPEGWGVRLKPKTCGGPGDRSRHVEFEIVERTKDQSQGTVSGGDSTCPYSDCGRLISGDDIKSQAQQGQMAEQLYAVVYRRRVVVGHTKSGKAKEKWVRGYRPPRPEDDVSASLSEAMEEKLPDWQALDIIPNENIGELSNYDRGHRMYGMNRWVDMFSPRQLFGHCLSVEVFRELLAEEETKGRLTESTRAAFGYLSFAVDKLVNYNARSTRWDGTTGRVRSVFDSHNFALVWSYAEMAPLVPGVGYDWAVEQTGVCIQELVQLGRREFEPEDRPQSGLPFGGNDFKFVPPPVTLTCGSGDSLGHIEDGSVDLVAADPPYYDNVMYAELSDFFYVWLKRTSGYLYPELFRRTLTDKENEAIANPAKFKDQKGAKTLAGRDYQHRMAAIFSECRRVLKPDGVMTLMFTHKATGAWDALTKGLMEAEFTITASWPINTEAEGSLHIKDKSAANSTVFLVCRPRVHAGDNVRYWEEVEPTVRQAVRQRIAQFQEGGIRGVDLYLSCFGPALEAFSQNWPLVRGTPRQDICWIPCDHIPARSWALFKARDTLRGVIESLRQEARA
jgi:putative DNA methylase